MTDARQIYFHEDDYCRQQLLPREASGYVKLELNNIEDFAESHRAPNGAGWTDLYIRKGAPVELGELKISRESFAQTVSDFLPAFDEVFTGYSTHREQCKTTCAWGRSHGCAIFADWNDQQIIQNIWTALFDRDEESILTATRAITAVGQLRPLIYVDWAWGYTCAAEDATKFATLLRSKLETIAERLAPNA